MTNLELSANLSGMNYNSSYQDAKITEAYTLGIGVEAPGGDALEQLAAARPDLNGFRVHQVGGTKMFLIDRGLKRHVPDPQTFNNLLYPFRGRDCSSRSSALLNPLTTS